MEKKEFEKRRRVVKRRIGKKIGKEKMRKY